MKNDSKEFNGIFDNVKENTPKLLYKIMIIILAFILSLTVFLNFNSIVSVLVYAVLISFVFVILAKKFGGIFDAVSDVKLIIVLSALCFVFKFLWICYVKIEPQVDYATFYYSAVNLSNSWFYPYRYLALFPHIFGYSTFLSVFIKIFGESVFLATLLNVILSVVSGILIYKIIRSMISATAAVCAYALWIVCPSQTIYNALVLSEPLYTTFILAFVYFVVVISKKEGALKWTQMLLYGFIAAIILQCINVSRPIAPVLIIALFIWIFVLRFKELFQRAFLVKWLSFFVAMLSVYFSLGGLWDLYFTARIGEAPASVPGYNIYVGFNTESNGTWNLEDAELLFVSYSDQEGATAVWAQEQMLNEAKERITSGEIDFARLFINKLSIFLGSDNTCVNYCGDAIQDNETMSMICNVFYYCMILLSLCGLYKMLKASHRSAVFILPLYVIGITCAQMLVEVAPRYHYSVIPFLIMIPQFYLFKRNNNKAEET